ncbi:MAG: heavy-metal-associated domain-containing protein [Lishizhenia sp.]
MKSIITAVIVTIGFFSYSQKQDKPSKKAETTIKTDVQCGDCEGRIEGKLNYTKGIKFAEVNVKADEILVRYNARKITLSEIETLISELGYDANNTKAVVTKQKTLPLCCQPGGHD